MKKILLWKTQVEPVFTILAHLSHFADRVRGGWYLERLKQICSGNRNQKNMRTASIMMGIHIS
jgi:hypothetical protein